MPLPSKPTSMISSLTERKYALWEVFVGVIAGAGVCTLVVKPLTCVNFLGAKLTHDVIYQAGALLQALPPGTDYLRVDNGAVLITVMRKSEQVQEPAENEP